MVPATQSARRTIGSFDGNFEELAALMIRSYGENREQPLRYTPEFLRSTFEYPGATMELAPAIYRDGRLAAFIAGFPRSTTILGEPRKLLTVSFLAVAPEEKRHGYGGLIWGELMRRARAQAYDGTINFCVDGDDMNRQMLALARAFRQPTVRISGIHYMARFLRGDETADVADNVTCDAATILREMAAAITHQAPLARGWSAEEAEWQCIRRQGALTAALCADDRRGMLSGYAMETSGAAPMLCVLLDDIIWGSLTPPECQRLARLLVSKAASMGAKMVTTPVLNYADMQPLAAAGFRKTRRLLHPYLTLWNAVSGSESISAMYMDVF